MARHARIQRAHHHGQQRRDRHAQRIAEMRRPAVQVARQQIRTPLLSRQEPVQGLIRAQRIGLGRDRVHGMVRHAVDLPRHVAQPPQYLHQQGVEFGIGLRHAAFAQLLQFEFQGAQFGLDAGAHPVAAVARHVQGQAAHVGGQLDHGVSHEQQDVAVGQRAPQGGVIRVGGHHAVEQVDHVDEQVQQSLAQPIGMGGGAARLFAQHHVARGLVRLGHDGLAADQMAVAVVQVLVDIVEAGPRGDVIGRGEQRRGQALLLLAVPHQPVGGGAVEQIEGPAQERGQRVLQHVGRRQRRAQGQGHDQQAGEAQQAAVLDVDGQHREAEAQGRHDQPDGQDVAGGQSGQRSGGQPRHRAANMPLMP